MTVRCTYCGGNHGQSLCPHTYSGSVRNAQLRCTYCGSSEHAYRYCPKTYSGNSNRRAEPNGEFKDKSK